MWYCVPSAGKNPPKYTLYQPSKDVQYFVVEAQIATQCAWVSNVPAHCPQSFIEVEAPTLSGDSIYSFLSSLPHI